VSRPTIRTVAKLAGVSPAAVSHAMNGRPNISPATAERIRKAAEELDWRPANSGRRLSGSVNSIGMVIARGARAFEMDPSFVHALTSVSAALHELEWSLVLSVFEDPKAELACYRTWWQEKRVDGFILLDPVSDDPRVELLRDMGSPAVTIGRSPDVSCVSEVVVEDADTMRSVLEYLRDHGHRHVARLSSPAHLIHTTRRDKAFQAEHRELFGAPGAIAESDRSQQSTVAAARRLLASDPAPTALVVDNEVMASTVVTYADELGVSIPDGLSVVSWEDSWLCEMVRPQITALRAPVEDSAREAVQVLRELIAGGSHVSRSVGPRVLVQRASVQRPGN
jgi:DNA-binding LacI/PurR family transcriptional regulator